VTHATEPLSPTTDRWRWLLSHHPHIRAHTAMSLLGLALMGGCAALLLWLAAIGHAPLQGVLLWSALAVGGLLVATVLIRTGRTQRWADPSLTLAQMLWATSCAAGAYVIAADARSMLPCMVAMVLLFGSLGLRARQIVGVTVYALVSMGGAMLLAPRFTGLDATVHDVAHALMAGVILLACMAVSLHLHALRTRLHRQRKDLTRALEAHRTLASRDPLTGLLNRRSMMELLELEQRRCQRGPRSMAIAMLDLDHFKRINDTYGHAAGDQALQSFAHTVRRTLRGADVLARWGGEEFVLLLSDVDAPMAHTLLERVGRAVAQTAVPEAPAQLRMTVSAGMTLHLPGEPVQDTLQRADRALYQAKHQGRNQVVRVDGTMPPALAPVPVAIAHASGNASPPAPVHGTSATLP